MLSRQEHERPPPLWEHARSGTSSTGTKRGQLWVSFCDGPRGKGGGSCPAPGSKEPQQWHSLQGGGVRA